MPRASPRQIRMPRPRPTNRPPAPRVCSVATAKEYSRMTFSDLCKALASTVASCGVLLVATAPMTVERVAWAQDTGAPQNVAPRNPRAPGSRNGSDEARITLNFQDADIGQVIDAVQMATHKSIIIDPRVRAQVTMRSSTPVTPDGFYQIFLSILAVHHVIAVPGANGVIKIVPDADERYYPGQDDLEDHVSGTSDEIITQVVPVKNVSATQLLTALRPLVPTSGQ